MRTITHSEFQAASGEPVYVSTVHYASAAERAAGDAAVQRVVVAAAFVPFGDKGEPFDPPEEWPSDKTATEYPPQAVSGEYAAQAVTPKQALDALAAQAQEFGLYNMPPNCDGYGEFVAQAAHTAAEGEGDCSAVGCVIPQIKDNGNLSGVPETGSKWDLDGVLVEVAGFVPKGRGGYVLWGAYNSIGGETKLSEWRGKAAPITLH